MKINKVFTENEKSLKIKIKGLKALFYFERKTMEEETHDHDKKRKHQCPE